MKFEYIPKINAHKKFGHIESVDKFYKFVEEFDIVEVKWNQPINISASYFLRLLQKGSSEKARGYGKRANQEKDDSSNQLAEFYSPLLDHGVLWKQKNGNVICTAMPYGDEVSITDSFYKMVEKFCYPDAIRMKFLDDTYRFRPNGDCMIVIYYDLEEELINLECTDDELHKKAIQYSCFGESRHTRTTNTYGRNKYVSEYAKRRAHGICQLCRNQAPFIDFDGKPFLETHHIIWLSKGGTDSLDNTVALCPNCHRKMHVLNLEEDVAKLLKIVTTEQDDANFDCLDER